MEEIISAITPSLNIVLGALAAIFGAMYQSRVNDKMAKAKLKAEKLERAYTLCQSIYDGHRREINNAKKNLLVNPEDYIKNRNHPGMEMSELKMLIRSYIPILSDSLQLIDNGHEPLKKAFRLIDEQALNSKPFDETEIKNQFKLWESDLEEISKGSNIIKSGLSKALQKLTE